MTDASLSLGMSQSRKQGLLFVFAAGVLWSTVGLGIRLEQFCV